MYIIYTYICQSLFTFIPGIPGIPGKPLGPAEPIEPG